MKIKKQRIDLLRETLIDPYLYCSPFRGGKLQNDDDYRRRKYWGWKIYFD